MALEEYRCDHVDCDFTSSSKLQRKDHSLSHSKDKQTCDLCGKDFASLRSLAVHRGKTHMKKNDVDTVPEVGEVNQESLQSPSLIVPSPARKIKRSKVKAVKVLKDVTQISPKYSTPRLKKRRGRPAKLFLVKDCEKWEKLEAGQDVTPDAPDVEGEARPLPCHCSECMPCTNLCCDNPPVRAGLCCHPTTLGRCLQPFQVRKEIQIVGTSLM